MHIPRVVRRTAVTCSLPSWIHLLSLLTACGLVDVARTQDAATAKTSDRVETSEATDASPRTGNAVTTISTAGAGAAGALATRGAAGEKRLERWTELLKARKGRELVNELDVYLTSKKRYAPDDGFAVLHDFFRHLDERPRVVATLPNDYNIAFAMMHLAMLREEETAAFSHYFLTATWDQPESYSRRLIYDWVSLFIGYHAGRFPDLESALRRDVDEKLRAKQGYLPVYFGALGALRYSPDIEILRDLLDTSTGRDVISEVLGHLSSRNDREASLTIITFLRGEKDLNAAEARLALQELASMTTKEAGRAMAVYLSGRNHLHTEPAWRAYLTEPRDVEDLTPLRRWLASRESDKRKVLLLRHIGLKNLNVLSRLASDPDANWPELVRKRLAELAGPESP